MTVMMTVKKNRICWPKLNPLTPLSDQDRISPHNIITIPIRKVIRIQKNIN